jgi:hypothetical protein
MAVFDGMRPGEIFEVRLGKISGNALLIDKRIYRGKMDTPKGRKGKKTSRTIALSSGTVATWSCGEALYRIKTRTRFFSRHSVIQRCGVTTSGTGR